MNTIKIAAISKLILLSFVITLSIGLAVKYGNLSLEKDAFRQVDQFVQSFSLAGRITTNPNCFI